MNPFATKEPEELAPLAVEEKEEPFFMNPFAAKESAELAPLAVEEKEEPFFMNPFATKEPQEQAPMAQEEKEERFLMNPSATERTQEQAPLASDDKEVVKAVAPMATGQISLQQEAPLEVEAEEEEEQTYFITSLPVAIQELEREAEIMTNLATSTLNGVNVSAAIGITMVTLSATAVASIRRQVQLDDNLAYTLPTVSPSEKQLASSFSGTETLPASAVVPSSPKAAAASGVTVMSFSDAVAIIRKQELRDSSISPLSRSSSDDDMLVDGPEDVPPFIPSVSPYSPQ
jgi:hypothetical protein